MNSEIYLYRDRWPADWREPWSIQHETLSVKHQTGLVVSFCGGCGIIVSGRYSDVIGLPHLMNQARAFFAERVLN